MFVTPRDLEKFLRPLNGNVVERYPLTNLSTIDNKLVIELALAGFNKNDIEIELKGNELHISGKKEVIEGSEDKKEYIQKHISQKEFTRIIVLHKTFVGGNILAEMQDGILTIEIEPVEQPKQFIRIK